MRLWISACTSSVVIILDEHHIHPASSTRWAGGGSEGGFVVSLNVGLTSICGPGVFGQWRVGLSCRLSSLERKASYTFEARVAKMACRGTRGPAPPVIGLSGRVARQCDPCLRKTCRLRDSFIRGRVKPWCSTGCRSRANRSCTASLWAAQTMTRF